MTSIAPAGKRLDEPQQLGGAHIRAVIRTLWALGDRPGSGDWLTAFAIVDR